MSLVENIKIVAPPPHNSKPHGCEKGVELVKGCQIREGAFIKETCYYSGPNESNELCQMTGSWGREGGNCMYKQLALR